MYFDAGLLAMEIAAHASEPLANRAAGLLASEAAGGVVLMAVAVLALLTANSVLAPAYFAARHINIMGLSVLHWINDCLFFLLIGLEIKSR
jgi:NhaA family Na+:H+ antiporter